MVTLRASLAFAVVLGVPTVVYAFVTTDVDAERHAAVTTLSQGLTGGAVTADEYMEMEEKLGAYVSVLASKCEGKTASVESREDNQIRKAQNWGMTGGVVAAASAASTYHPVASFLATIAGLLSTGQNSLATTSGDAAKATHAQLANLSGAITTSFDDYFKIVGGDLTNPTSPPNGYYVIVQQRMLRLQKVEIACAGFSKAAAPNTGTSGSGAGP